MYFPPRTLILAGLLLLGAALPAAAAPAGKKTPLVELCDPTQLGSFAVNNAFPQPESTRRMVALINKIYAEADPLKNQFRSTDQIPLLRAKIVDASVPAADRVNLKLQLAQHLMQAGFIEESIQEFGAIEPFIRDQHLPPDPGIPATVLLGQAMAHLRAGETANCLLNHNADSCLFPIQGGGIHQIPDGSRAAIGVLTELLTKYRGDLRARWLLNIAYMTLGEYPNQVPPSWLIPPKAFAADYDLGRFPDIAANVGLGVDGLAGGVVVEDFDHDGFLDVMVSAQGFTPKDQIRVFRNNGDGRFTERTNEAGLAGLVSGLNLIHGDYNNDGFADVLVLRGGWLGTEGKYPFSLLRNNGDFTFTDVTEEAGLMHLKPTQTAVWFDYNSDGWLDLFVGNEWGACELYRNNADGTFTECAAANGLAITAFVKGVATGDYNNDGRPDLFLSTRGAPKILLRNDGPAGGDRTSRAAWKFTDVTEAAGISGQLNTFPCWFWDYDNDGWQDIMVTGYAIADVGDVAADYLGRPNAGQKARLYHNNGNGTFTDASKAAGVNKLLHAMSANFGDLDNDGWLDFYLGTGNPDFTTLIPNRMFRNDGGQRFQEITTSGGFGQLQKGHGIAFADLNNDGTQDIYSKVGGAVETDNYRSQLFFNPGFGNHWLKLLLEGKTNNRVAIGARIKVVVREAGRERSLYRTIGTGATFGSSPLRQEIGLGRAEAIDRVEIFWPVTGVTQVVRGLELDRTYAIGEGRAEAVSLPLKSFKYALSPPAGYQHQH